MREGEGRLEGVESGAPATPKDLLELYQNMPIHSRFNHIFDYEGNYYSYVIAQILSQHLYDKNEQERRRSGSRIGGGCGVSEEIRDIYSKGGAIDYNALFR